MIKKLELGDEVKAYKENLAKLTMINKGKHYNNYFLEYNNNKKKSKTWDGIRQIIDI